MNGAVVGRGIRALQRQPFARPTRCHVAEVEGSVVHHDVMQDRIVVLEHHGKSLRELFTGVSMSGYPRRIVCLTEETTETLYLLGQGDRIVGVSGYTVRPPEARDKPKISAFINAKFDKIVALEPDLVLAFSDLQADLTAELVRRGLNVVTFNQRSIDEILQMIRMVGALVGCQGEAEALADRMAAGLDDIRVASSRF